MRLTTFLVALIYALLVALADIVSGSSTNSATSTSLTITPTPSPTSNTATGTVTGSPVSPSAAPTNPFGGSVFQFAPPDNVTICQSLTLTWSFNGQQPTTVMLVVTNVDSSIPPNLKSAQNISQTIVNDTSAYSGIFVWPSADVPAGPYVVIAFNYAASFDIAVIAVPSPLFYVLSGPDESCLNSTTSQTSGSSSVTANHKSTIAGLVIGVVAALVL